MYSVIENLSSNERRAIEVKVRRLIEKELGTAVSSIVIDWHNLDCDVDKINVTIKIRKESDPKQWRNRFGGLTSKVVTAIGQKSSQIFPVLQAVSAV